MVSQCFAVTGVPDSRHWIAAGFGGGGTFSMIVPDHFTAGKYYAIPDVNAPYVSTNSGGLWSFLSTVGGVNSGYLITQTASFVQSKNNASLMYALDSQVQGGLQKSTDGGQTWTKVLAARGSKGYRQIAIDPTNDNKVYVASAGNGTFEGGRVYATTNGGASFSLLFRPFDVSVTAESAEITGSTATRTGALNNLSNILKGSVVFTSASGETFTDDGAGNLVSNMGGSGTIKYANINTTQGANKYGNYSLTFGSTPSATTVSYTVSYTPLFIYVSSNGENIIVGRSAASGTTLVKYNIAGGTITPITLAGTNATYNRDFSTYVDGSGTENFCVTAGHKIACTADLSTFTYTAETTSSATYYIKKFGVKRKSDSSLTFVISRNTTSNEFTVANQISTDSGVTWSSVGLTKNLSMNPTNAYNAGGLYFSIVPSPHNETDWFISTDWSIFKSVNGGANFTESVTGGQNVVSHHVAISPNGRVFLTSMDTGIQYSDDFGATWIAGTPSTAKGQGYSTNSATDYGGHYWRVITTGTKADWDAGNGKVFVAATMYSTPVALFYVNYVLRSLDNGVTWTRSNVGLPKVRLFGDATWGNGYARALASNVDGSVLYVGMDGQNDEAGTRGGMFRSTDNGATWTRLWPNNPNRVFNAIAVDPTDLTGATALFGTFQYNLYRITNALTTAVVDWVDDGNGPRNFIQEVGYDSTGRPYALSQYNGAEIYRSINTAFGDGSGQYGTWRLMKNFSNTGLPDGLVIDPQNNNRIFVSVTEGNVIDRRVWVTTEASKHTSAKWYDITGDLPVVGGCRALALNPFEGTKGYLYCASNGAAMYKLDLSDSPAFTPNRTYFGGGANE